MSMASIPTPHSTDWQDRLDAARSVADVVDLCHEYVSQCTPEQLAELPPGLLPPERLDAATISSYAVELVKRELASGELDSTLKRFASFFTDASACLARIAMARTRRDGWAYVALRR